MGTDFHFCPWCRIGFSAGEKRLPIISDYSFLAYLKKRDPAPVGLLDCNISAYVGRSERAGAENYFNGQIDDIKIYNYTLTPQQIKEVYNYGTLFFGPSEGSP
jgi:hypothetical protein